MNKFIKRVLRKTRFNSKTNSIVLFLFVLVLLFGVGYAYLNTTLSIEGVTNVDRNIWDIHFENIQVQSGSVEATTQPTISNQTTVSFGVTLENPGDFYEFTVDVVNAGTLDAKIDSLTVLPTLTTEQQEYFDYSVTYSDGIAIQQNDALNSGVTETIKVRIEYKENSDTSLYPDEDVDFDFSVTLDYIQGSGNAIAHPSFANDSWSTIVNNIQNNTIPYYYTVGEEKEVDMGSLGTHTIRIANTTTPTECSTTGFSQTACGFVLEFADIITRNKINSTDTNVGGWPASEMRTYINSDIYNALPTEVKNGIINTSVVSGYGESDSNNFTSIDKLYLLSSHEVFEDVDGRIYDGIDFYDTAYNNTRQLDYYAGLNITNLSYSGACKKRNGSNSSWCLRSARSTDAICFFEVSSYGYWGGIGANLTSGVAPAFRIA